MIKPDYILKLELNEDVYSTIENKEVLDSISIFDDNKNLELIYSESVFENKRVRPQKKLYKSKSDFYLYLEDEGFGSDRTRARLTIYYKPKQLSEITVFLLQLNKK